MEEDFGFNMEKPEEVNSFERMLRNGSGGYFDVGDFEAIIDYYQYENLLDKALCAAEYAISLHPGSIPLKLRIATLLASKNDEKGALSLIEEVEKYEPGNFDLYLTKGAIYSQLQYYEKAIEEYSKALPDADEPDHICCNIAFEYENLGDYSKTIEYLRKALDYNPNNFVAMYEAAYCFDLLSLNEESISFFEKHIDKHPYSVEAWFNLGVSYINASLFEKAIDAFDYCLAIDESHKPAYIQKAIAYSNINDYIKAIDCYKEYIGSNEDTYPHPMVNYYIAECYEKMEEYENACDYYKLALKHDDEITDAWIGKGVCEIETGNVKMAIKSMLKGLSQDPENTSYLCLIADAYLSINDKESCIKYFEKAILYDEKDIETWLDYSEAMMTFEDFDEAIKILARGEEFFVNEPVFQYKIAICLYFLGKYNEADFFLEEALQLDQAFNNIKILGKYPALYSISSFLKVMEIHGP